MHQGSTVYMSAPGLEYSPGRHRRGPQDCSAAAWRIDSSRVLRFTIKTCSSYRMGMAQPRRHDWCTAGHGRQGHRSLHRTPRCESATIRWPGDGFVPGRRESPKCLGVVPVRTHPKNFCRLGIPSGSPSGSPFVDPFLWIKTNLKAPQCETTMPLYGTPLVTHTKGLTR